jgi:hypothetical protein
MLIRLKCSIYIVRTKEEDAPVMVGVTASRPVAVTIDLVVGDRNTTTSLGTKNDMLTANEGGRAMVNPNIVGSVKSDSITTPDNVRVEVRNMNVLDDNVLDTIGKTETLALDNTLRANTDDALVRANHDGVQAGLVIFDVDLGSVRFVIGAPQVLIDSKLAVSASSPRCTASFAGRALGVLEVKSALKVDDTSGVVLEVVDELLVVLRANDLATISTGSASGETLGLSRQGGKGSREECRNGDKGVEQTHDEKIE